MQSGTASTQKARTPGGFQESILEDLETVYLWSSCSSRLHLVGFSHLQQNHSGSEHHILLWKYFIRELKQRIWERLERLPCPVAGS